jgi:hypothetical protein
MKTPGNNFGVIAREGGRSSFSRLIVRPSLDAPPSRGMTAE